jgi:hypothetical protein
MKNFKFFRPRPENFHKAKNAEPTTSKRFLNSKVYLIRHGATNQNEAFYKLLDSKLPTFYYQWINLQSNKKYIDDSLSSNGIE